MKLSTCPIIFILALLSGCASTAIGDAPALTHSGTTSIEVEPVFAPEGQVKVGTKYKALFAKEYDSFEADLLFDEDGNVNGINFSAGGVKAFEGQRISAQAFTDIQNTLSEQNIEISKVALEAIKASLLKSIIPVP